MRSRTALFLPLVLLLANGGTAEAETVLEMITGQSGLGGNPLRTDYEPGSYVVGFKGRAGDWLDQISIVCGRWNDKTQKLQSASQGKAARAFGDSTGGEALSESCPDGWAVSGFAVRFNQHELGNTGKYFSRLVHAVRFYCRPAIAGQGQVAHYTIGSWSHGHVSGFSETSSCPPRELATGMHGRAGLYVDALGLVCNLRPEPATVGVEAKLPDSSVLKPAPVDEKLKKGGVIAAPAPPAGGDNVLPKKPVGKQGTSAGGDNVLPKNPVGRKPATVIADVDVYKQTGGKEKLGILYSNNQTTKVSLIEPCQANWCHVKGDAVPTGEGWVYSGTPPDFQSLQF